MRVHRVHVDALYIVAHLPHLPTLVELLGRQLIRIAAHSIAAVEDQRNQHYLCFDGQFLRSRKELNHERPVVIFERSIEHSQRQRSRDSDRIESAEQSMRCWAPFSDRRFEMAQRLRVEFSPGLMQIASGVVPDIPASPNCDTRLSSWPVQTLRHTF